jgi:hypothetical protein
MLDANFPSHVVDYVTANTRLMRSGDYPGYVALRELLRQRGVDPATTVAAHLSDEGGGSWSGALVTADRNVFDFSLARINGDWTLTWWSDETDNRENAEDQDVTCAFTLLNHRLSN